MIGNASLHLCHTPMTLLKVDEMVSEIYLELVSCYWKAKASPIVPMQAATSFCIYASKTKKIIFVHLVILLSMVYLDMSSLRIVICSCILCLRHAGSLAKFTASQLLNLRHENGANVCVLYGRHSSTKFNQVSSRKEQET